VIQAAAEPRTFARPSRSRPRRRPAGRRFRLACYGVVAVGLLVVLNWGYHAVRKPTELLAPVSPALAKTPSATWAAYGHLFAEHSTEVMTPELLAALAQVEGSGNPIARTYWRWQWSLNPLEIYRPASSAVGMLQITDGTFREARRYCIHDHTVARIGPWYDWTTCWFNGLYSRLVPSHAVELTSARLHVLVVEMLSAERLSRATREQKEDLAAVIHLCGPKRGDAFARRGFRVAPGERCGDHDVRHYLARVGVQKRQFARLGTAG
jgi:hypothetical protein